MLDEAIVLMYSILSPVPVLFRIVAAKLIVHRLIRWNYATMQS